MIERKEVHRWVVKAPRNWEVSYDSHPRHRMKDRPRFLEGNTLNRDRRETDSQRQKLYNAERKITRGESFDGMEEVTEEIEDILSRAWWQRRYPSGPVNVYDGRRNRRATADGSVVKGKVKLPKWSRNQRVILHELTHLTVPPPHAAHGRLFASRFLELVEWRIGDEVAGNLKEAYREENVRWHPRRKMHADHLGKGVKERLLKDGCPDWADRKQVERSKGVRPTLTF